jgi:hypothetical protein
LKLLGDVARGVGANAAARDEQLAIFEQLIINAIARGFDKGCTTKFSGLLHDSAQAGT